MKLAWKEIRHSITKYLLIESILVLMIFMVVFLSGLTHDERVLDLVDAVYRLENAQLKKVANY